MPAQVLLFYKLIFHICSAFWIFTHSLMSKLASISIYGFHHYQLIEAKNASWCFWLWLATLLLVSVVRFLASAFRQSSSPSSCLIGYQGQWNFPSTSHNDPLTPSARSSFCRNSLVAHLLSDLHFIVRFLDLHLLSQQVFATQSNAEGKGWGKIAIQFCA